MIYFALLQVLPPEIVKIIHHYILISTSIDKLSHFIKNKKKRIYNINSFIYDLLYNETSHLITDFNIARLNFILNSKNTNYYNHVFWCNALHIFGKKLYEENLNIGIKNMTIYVQTKKERKLYYSKLKENIKLWYLLCKKNDVILNLVYYNFNSRKVGPSIIKPATHIKKIHSFHNLVYSPTIHYSPPWQHYPLEKEEAIQYLIEHVQPIFQDFTYK